MTNWKKGAGSKQTPQKLINRQEIPIPCEGGQAMLLVKKYETYWKAFMYFTPDGGNRSQAGEIYFNFAKGPPEVLNRCVDKFLGELEGPETDQFVRASKRKRACM